MTPPDTTPVNPRPEPGEWYLLIWDELLQPFYVTNTTRTSPHVCVVRTTWRSDNGQWMALDEFFNERQASYLGKGRRTFISYLPFIGTLFPKYTQP
jgi:hypothetical protein